MLLRKQKTISIRPYMADVFSAETADLLVPPATLLKKFGDAVTLMAEAINTLSCQIQNLRRTRDLLLPRLLSGQIDVEALDHA